MKPQIVKEQNTLAYTSAGTAKLAIGAQPFYITGLLLELELAKTDSTTPTTFQDFMWRSIKNLSLMGGGRPYMNISGPDLRMLYWATRSRLNGRGRAPDMQAGAVTFRHQLPILFTPHPLLANGELNISDPTVGIKPDADLNLAITWAANTAIGTQRTIGTGTVLRVSYLGIVPVLPADYPKWYPYWVGTQWTPAAAQLYPGLSALSPLTPGYHYRRSTVVGLNGASPSDVRTDDTGESVGISEVGVVTSDGRHPLNVKMWDFSQMSQAGWDVADDNSGVPGAAAAYGTSVTSYGRNPGVGLIDWGYLADTTDPNFADRTFGINLIGKQPTTAQIAFTVNATSNVSALLMHEAYMPY